MMKDDELWLKKIKERLDDYSEPLPDTGWERLEKVLPASAPMSVGKKKQIMFRRWAMTAAAVVLVAVSSVSLWLLQSPVVDEVRRAAEPALATIPDVLPEQTKPDTQGEQPGFSLSNSCSAAFGNRKQCSGSKREPARRNSEFRFEFKCDRRNGKNGTGKGNGNFIFDSGKERTRSISSFRQR